MHYRKLPRNSVASICACVYEKCRQGPARIPYSTPVSARCRYELPGSPARSGVTGREIVMIQFPDFVSGVAGCFVMLLVHLQTPEAHLS